MEIRSVRQQQIMDMSSNHSYGADPLEANAYPVIRGSNRDYFETDGGYESSLNNHNHMYAQKRFQSKRSPYVSPHSKLCISNRSRSGDKNRLSEMRSRNHYRRSNVSPEVVVLAGSGVSRSGHSIL